MGELRSFFGVLGILLGLLAGGLVDAQAVPLGLGIIQVDLGVFIVRILLKDALPHFARFLEVLGFVSLQRLIVEVG